MAKLHELLAVNGDLQGAANKITTETIHVFGKPELFTRSLTTATHFDEADKSADDIKETAMTTNVPDKLAWMAAPNIRFWDNILRRESANQHAVADIKVGEQVLAEKVPATVLLTMENKLSELRKVYEAIPTLPSGGLWEADPATGEHVYVNRQLDTRLRTRKHVRPVEMSPATQHHPAQVQALSEDTPIGKIVTKTWSGMLTSAQKAILLERVDQLHRAVKTARQRANTQDAPERRFGKQLFDFLHEGIVA